MLFSVVIPTYKRCGLLIDCLNCLAHYFEPNSEQRLGFKVEVIVSDDSFDLELEKLLSSLFIWCQYIEGPARGPAANRNHGAHQAIGDWLVFTDDDCLPQRGWLEAYFLHAHQYDVLEGRTSATGVRIRADDECPINESGGFLFSCNFAVKRTTFLQLGGFNVDFPAAAMEDVELNTRIFKARLNCMFVPDAVVFHPWRQRKGRRYVRLHSYSVGRYVSLHPEQAARFSAYAQIISLIRLFKRTLGQTLLTGIYQGFFRMLFLDFYSVLLTWKYVRNVNLH